MKVEVKSQASSRLSARNVLQRERGGDPHNTSPTESLHGESEKEERKKYFDQLAATVKLLRDRREAQEKIERKKLEAPRLPSIVAEGVMEEGGREVFNQRHSVVSVNQMYALGNASAVVNRQSKKYYYPDLTAEEEKMLENLVREANEIKLRMKVKYDPRTVQGTWALLIRGDQLMDFGLDLYGGLIEEKVYLPRQMTGMTTEKRITFLFSILDQTIGLYDNQKEMFEKLSAAGIAHRRFGVGEAGFYALRNSFMTAFHKYMSPEVCKASAADWAKFWKLSISIMLQAGRSPEGVTNGELFAEECRKEIVEALESIAAAHQRSKKLEDHLVQRMLAKAVEFDPPMTRYKAFFSTRRACDRLFSSILVIAKNASNPKENEEYMGEIGARHVAYMVNREVLTAFEAPYLLACESFLKEKWTPTLRYNMKQFYRDMVEGIAAGMDTGMNTGENKRAPDGSSPFCLLFTDIESSTNLWQKNAKVMKEAVAEHHRMIRSIISDYNAYEVKTAGDSFIIAANDVLVGLKISIAIQLELMRHLPIVPGFEMLDEVQGGGDPSAWSNQTLRVRIGIEHCTQATATYDTIHRRYDYYGPSVNQCARIEAAAAGGQILMSKETFKALKAIPAFHDEPCPPELRDLSGNSPMDERGFDHFVAMCDVGKAKLKGISKKVRLASVVPMCLAGRAFKLWSSAIDM